MTRQINSMRATIEEKDMQIDRLHEQQARQAHGSPISSSESQLRRENDRLRTKIEDLERSRSVP